MTFRRKPSEAMRFRVFDAESTADRLRCLEELPVAVQQEWRADVLASSPGQARGRQQLPGRATPTRAVDLKLPLGQPPPARTLQMQRQRRCARPRRPSPGAPQAV